jgi:hypothetical protein
MNNSWSEILKSFFSNLQSILIVGLVLIILLMRECDGEKPVVKTIIETKETVKWDTIKIPEITYVPKWQTKIVRVTDTIPQDIDTMEILKDYYAKYFYSDTLDIDTIGNIVINDTITQNKIFARKPKVNIQIPVVTKEITITKIINEREFYYGVGLQGSTDQLNYLGGEFLYRTKKKNAYGVSLGINQDFSPIIGGKVYWKIGE